MSEVIGTEITITGKFANYPDELLEELSDWLYDKYDVELFGIGSVPMYEDYYEDSCECPYDCSGCHAECCG